MFKKLMSFLFEEVDVIEEEIEPSYDLSLSQKDTPVSKMKMIDLEEKNPYIAEVPLVQQKSLDFSMEKNERKGELKSSVKKELNQTVPYQTSSIISPIFGKKEQTLANPKVSQTPLGLPQENSSILGTVFSPIYGVVKTKPAVNKSQTEVLKHMSMDDLFNEEDISVPNIQQRSMDELFVEQKKSKNEEKKDHHFFDNPAQESEDESVQTMFRSLFDE